jgi:PLD-like domain
MPRHELLITAETANWLKKLMRAPGLARLAVAFWGNGAVRNLGLGQRKGETRILRDLFSGGCNPDEIKRLLKPKIEVRYLKGLHAKLYCTDDGTVVGSSNASTNGLGDEDAELAGNIELNVFFDAKSLQVAAREWFDRQWKDAELNVVDNDIAESAPGVWKRRPSQTLLQSIAADPDSLRGSRIKVLVYNADGSEDEEERSFKKQLVPGLYTELEWKKMVGFYDFYLDTTDWSAEPGTGFMDFHWGSERAIPRFPGCVASQKQETMGCTQRWDPSYYL